MTQRALVYGVAVAGMATLRALVARGYDVIVVDDAVTPTKVDAVARLGLEIVERPSAARIRDLVSRCDFVAPSPGVAEGHPVIVEAHSLECPIRTELDLGYEWESQRVGGPRAMLTVTGTDGKTTTVMMAEAMLHAAGVRSVACGNTEVPFVEALDMDVDAFVIEATSFRLAFVESFRSDASAWLNFAPDHLDWHTSMDSYEAAKARLWRHVNSNDVAIGCVGDPVVMRHLDSLTCRRVTVGGDTGEYRVADGVLQCPRGSILDVSQMYRSLPHDQSNALVSAALVLESDLADLASVGASLTTFRGPKHRIEFVTESRGVRYFDDSKATTPHAASTAMQGFESIVLIAGGRNKGLDLTEMARDAHKMRGVVVIGEAADELAHVFAGRCPVVRADSMLDAVDKAVTFAHSGDVVLLSPGCTSLDWYGGYADRGDDFARCVADVVNRPRTSHTEGAP